MIAGTELPIRDVRASVALGSKADPDFTAAPAAAHHAPADESNFHAASPRLGNSSNEAWLRYSQAERDDGKRGQRSEMRRRTIPCGAHRPQGGPRMGPIR
jgi:hypothetical protein